MCKVYTGYRGTSEIEHALCACKVDNSLAKAREFSLRTGAQTMLFLSLVDLSLARTRLELILCFRMAAAIPHRRHWDWSGGRRCWVTFSGRASFLFGKYKVTAYCVGAVGSCLNISYLFPSSLPRKTEAEIFSGVNRIPLHIAFPYHPSIVPV